jgi:hypothetical protein
VSFYNYWAEAKLSGEGVTLSIGGFGFLSTDCSVRVSFSVKVNSTGAWGSIVVENPERREVSLDNAWPLRIRVVIEAVGGETFSLDLNPLGGPVAFSDESYVYEAEYSEALPGGVSGYENIVVEAEMKAMVGDEPVTVRGVTQARVYEEPCLVSLRIDVGSKPGAVIVIPLDARRLSIEAPAGDSKGLMYDVLREPGGGAVIRVLFEGRDVSELASLLESALNWTVGAGIVGGITGMDVRDMVVAVHEGAMCSRYVEYLVYWSTGDWVLEEIQAPAPAATPVTAPTVEAAALMTTQSPAGTPQATGAVEAERGVTGTGTRETFVEDQVYEEPEVLGDAVSRTAVAAAAGAALAISSWLVLRRLIW